VRCFQTLLHPQNQVPSTLTPKEKSTSGPVPINNNFSSNPTPVQAPRTEFQPVPAPVMHNNRDRDNPVFSGQDVDLRSLDPRGGSDPRLSRMGDQDMRTLPGQLPNPLPPPIVEK
jgi:cleavage stimulation factor subunit 2